jgi:dihydroxyacid dehydratase/phosphogluconate dehydratase
VTIQPLRKQETSAPFYGAGALVGAQTGGFAIMHGTLAPEGCVDCTARVFGHAEAAQDAIMAGDIADGDIIIMRGASTEALTAISRSLDIMGLAEVSIITDSRVGHATNGYMARVIANVAPSAAAGGPIALVRDGDTIHIDLAARRIDLMSDAAAKGAQTFNAHAPKAFAPGERFPRQPEG